MGILPPGVEDPFSLPEIAKEFLALLICYSPDRETLKTYYNYKDEYQKILNTDYSNKHSKNILERIARSKRLNLNEYKRELNNNIRNQEIEDLNRKYGILKNESDEISDPLEELRKNIGQTTKDKEDLYSKIFKRPDTV